MFRSEHVHVAWQRLEAQGMIAADGINAETI
jgi:hypothetical protein